MLNRRQLIASGTGLLLAGASARANAQQTSLPSISSTRFISMNADTGAIFAQQNAHDQVAIASITKVFTLMEAINLAPLDTLITTTADDYQPADASIMGFDAGETFTLDELIHGMMLPSGNDAAYAIARGLGHQEGDTAEEAVQRFLDLVNQRVLAMGLQNTHLLNPDGWGVPGHYSSAADVAAFMAYAATNEYALRVMGTRSYTTRSGYVLVNNNRALANAPSVLGGKTGYDWDSGWCLVQIAQRQDTRIVAVNLDGVAPDTWYNDNLLLLDYGFDQQTALGGDPFEGDVMSWRDPLPTIFAQSATGEVSIAGETVDDEFVITQEETHQPERIQIESVPESIAFDGRKSDGRLAGIGAAALAGAMAVSRWLPSGDDQNQVSVGDGARAIGGSLKRMLPPLPSFASRSTSDDRDEAPELRGQADDYNDEFDDPTVSDASPRNNLDEKSTR